MKTLFVNVSSAGHVVPTLDLVGRLVARGVDVAYVEIEAHKTELEAVGARFLPLPTFPSYDGPTGSQIAKLPVILAHCAIKATGWILDIIDRERPDVLVHDSLCLWGRLAADLARVPRVASIASAAISSCMLTKDPLALAWRSREGDVAPFRVHYRKSWDEITRSYGCAPEDEITAVLNVARRNIVHLSRSLQPEADQFGPDYIFCGSGEPARYVAQNFDWERIRDRRVVFVSFGTAHDPGHAFYQAVAEAMTGIDAVLVVVESGSMSMTSSIAWPVGTIVCRNGQAPQIALLQRASLFISHVGGGAVREAAWMAAPILGFPQTMEQDLLCRNLVERGAALRLPDTPDMATIRRCIETMLREPVFRASANALAALQREGPSRNDAVLTIEEEALQCA